MLLVVTAASSGGSGPDRGVAEVEAAGGVEGRFGGAARPTSCPSRARSGVSASNWGYFFTRWVVAVTGVMVVSYVLA